MIIRLWGIPVVFLGLIISVLLFVIFSLGEHYKEEKSIPDSERSSRVNKISPASAITGVAGLIFDARGRRPGISGPLCGKAVS